MGPQEVSTTVELARSLVNRPLTPPITMSNGHAAKKKAHEQPDGHDGDTKATNPEVPSGKMMIDQAAYIEKLEGRLETMDRIVNNLLTAVELKRYRELGPNDTEARIDRVLPHQWRAVKRKEGLIETSGCLMVSCSTGRDGRYQRLAINSKFLLRFLSDLIGEPLTADENVLVWPFKHLVLYETQIRQALEDAVKKSNSDPNKPEHNVARDHLKCLVEFMDDDMQSIFQTRQQLENLSMKTITFDYLWHLFQPGDLVISQAGALDPAVTQAFIVLHVTGGRTSFSPGNMWRRGRQHREWDEESESERRSERLVKSSSTITAFVVDCVYLDYDGISVGPRPKRFVITAYPGEKPIVGLEIYPVKFDPDAPAILERLRNRGKKFIETAKGGHRRYTGSTIREFRGRLEHHNQYFEICVEEIETEVIVDQSAAIREFQYKYSACYKLEFNNGILAAPTPADDGETFDRLPEKRGFSVTSDIHEDAAVDVNRRSIYLSQNDILRLRNLDMTDFADLHLQLLSPRIYGYALLNRKWFPLKVALLRDVEDLDQPGGKDIAKDVVKLTRTRFDDLVLPSGHKKLLQASVKYYTRQEAKQSPDSMDIVYGKGRGLIILLHGPPGTGKTSTAECVASELRRPLLPITCGDLSGNGSRGVEKSLEKFCNLAHKWRCVLLLDEADVFLSKREKGDTDRNSYVAVFLRVLEYYSGVLILTSNRVGEIDEAFRSRIHICLSYPTLEQRSTEKIWESNIAHIKSGGLNVDIDEDDIRRYYTGLWAETDKKKGGPRHWNGRQIRNAFQTAIALAHQDFEDLPEAKRNGKPTLYRKHFKSVGKSTAQFDEYMANLYGLEPSQDAYSVLAEREEVRLNTIPAGASGSNDHKRPRRRKNKPVKKGRSVNTSSNSDSDATLSEFEQDESSDEDVEKLELKLEIAKLRKQQAKKGVSRHDSFYSQI